MFLAVHSAALSEGCDGQQESDEIVVGSPSVSSDSVAQLCKAFTNFPPTCQTPGCVENCSIKKKKIEKVKLKFIEDMNIQINARLMAKHMLTC